MFFFIKIKLWPIRLVVRTSGFHPGNRGSIPLWATLTKNFKKDCTLISAIFFLFPTSTHSLTHSLTSLIICVQVLKILVNRSLTSL